MTETSNDRGAGDINIEDYINEIIALSEYVDKAYYLATHSDVKDSGIDPAEHYCMFGWREGRDPTPYFNTSYYLTTNSDVEASGVNPFLHYIHEGKREGRLPKPPAIDEHEYALIDKIFDRAYYLEKYEDVKISGMDPVEHYCMFGWREGRNPTPDFDTTYYIATNSDVALSGVNPFLHYIYEGKREGRQTKPPLVEQHELALVSQHLDRGFYDKAYPSVRETGMDPVEHYCGYGWREGKNPSLTFDTNYYLKTNQDIQVAGINPFYHYLLAGRDEGRAARPRLHLQREIIETARSKSQEAGDWSDGLDISADLSFNDVCRVLDEYREVCSIYLSISHDDYSNNYGGIQNLIGDEARASIDAGDVYLHVSPAIPLPCLSIVDADLFVYTLKINGKTVGKVKATDLSAALGKKYSDHSSAYILVHHLMGHSAQSIISVVKSLPNADVLFWVHDFFSICPNYNLLRNNHAYCHGPDVSALSCKICVHGHDRRKHLQDMASIFDVINPIVLAPSKSAVENWISMNTYRYKRTSVQPLATLENVKDIAKSDRNESSHQLKIAHLGARTYPKGWHIYQELALKFGHMENYEFHQLGNTTGAPTTGLISQHSVTVTPHNRVAMIEEIKNLKIDVAVIWPMWPETFNYIAFEAMSAGTFIITHPNSGNVAPATLLYNSDQVKMVEAEADLFHLFETKQIGDLVRQSRRKTSEMKSVAGSIDWLKKQSRNKES